MPDRLFVNTIEAMKNEKTNSKAAKWAGKKKARFPGPFSRLTTWFRTYALSPA